MKVVAFNGSPRKNGNTFNSLKIACDELNTHGIDTEIVQVGGKLLHGCVDCGHCKKVADKQCSFKDDDMNTFIAKAIEADGIIVGSPVYFGNVTTEIKALIDRMGRVTRANGFLLKGKVGSAAVAMRRTGSNFTFAAINYLFTINEMYVASSSYWNVIVASAPEDWKKDEEGQGTLKKLGENMAYLLEKLN